jgi:hypothetical protein
MITRRLALAGLFGGSPGKQHIADTFAEPGLIPRKIDVRDIVWTVPTN